MNDYETISRAPSRSAAVRIALLVAGWLSVSLGVIGMFVPLLPTTCFLLLGGACFARSSPRASHWLHHNRWFGRYLTDYREARVIPTRVKALSITVLWATIGITIVLLDHLGVRIGLFVLAAIITAHVGTTASRRTDVAVASAMATTPGPS
jgi:uncharacterized protein